jgi:Winged helix-turn helix
LGGIMAKKYIVDLSEDEVSQLQTLIKTGKHKARIITRVHILLMASEGKTDKTIAEALRIHVSTVERTREEFVLGGLDFILSDRPHPPKPRKLDGRQEAFARCYSLFKSTRRKGLLDNATFSRPVSQSSDCRFDFRRNSTPDSKKNARLTVVEGTVVYSVRLTPSMF